MGAGVVFFGEEGADLPGGRSGRSRACDGGLDNGREVEHFFARVGGARLAEESLLAVSPAVYALARQGGLPRPWQHLLLAYRRGRRRGRPEARALCVCVNVVLGVWVGD